MVAVSVSHLNKTYRAHQKEKGFGGSLKSLFVRKYEDVPAVTDVSFEIEAGELVGFIGPNGAGKTTTLKCLSGLLYPTSGNVSVAGFKPWERKSAYLKQIALVMGQKNQLWWDLPAIESFHLNREIYEIPEKKYTETLHELTRLLDVEEVLHIQVRKLSLGQRMKCELIAALIHSPKVLFLDEPTIGLDVVMQKNLRDFIGEYNKKFGATIILTSHYMEDVRQLCKRVIIIDHGKILFDGDLVGLVNKYADEKYITVSFTKSVSRRDIAKLGKIEEFEQIKTTISIPKKDTNKVTARLLKTYPVEDLTISEPDIEDIIRDVFTKKAVT